MSDELLKQEEPKDEDVELHSRRKATDEETDTSDDVEAHVKRK